MDETPDFASLPERVGDNPEDDEPLVIQMVYLEGPHYWNIGRLVEVRSFWDADQQMEVWGDEGRAAFVVYILGELVYEGSYDLSVKPVDLRRQMVLYLEQLGTEDADRLLGAMAEMNPEKGFIDPVTGAWRPASQFDVQLYEPGEEYDPEDEDEDIPEAVVSETIVEDQPTVDEINQALLAGTVGIGAHGLVTETRRPGRRPAPPVDEDEDEDEEEEFDGGRFERDVTGVDPLIDLEQEARRVLERHGREVADWGEYIAGRHQANDDRRHQGNEAMLRDLRAIQDQRDPSFIRGYAEVILNVARAEPADDQGINVLGAGGQLPTTVLTEQFGRARPLPWNPAIDGWFLGGHRWIQYRLQQADGTPLYSVVDWDGVNVDTLFTGCVDEVIPWTMTQGGVGEPRTVGHGVRLTVARQVAQGVRRISSNDPGGQTYIVDGEYDVDGFVQWVNDAVGFFNEKDARSDMTHFPSDPGEERIPYRGEQELFRLHGPWRVEERAAVFKHRRADAGFINRFRLFAAGEADKGQRVQLFYNLGQIRDIVICTWIASFDAETDTAIVGFRLINGDNGIEIMNGQVDVSAADWNEGNSTVRKIMDMLSVRTVFVDNGWPEEYYLNIGFADNPFVYF
jgi:hypothetical protein